MKKGMSFAGIFVVFAAIVVCVHLYLNSETPSITCELNYGGYDLVHSNHEYAFIFTGKTRSVIELYTSIKGAESLGAKSAITLIEPQTIFDIRLPVAGLTFKTNIVVYRGQPVSFVHFEDQTNQIRKRCVISKD